MNRLLLLSSLRRHTVLRSPLSLPRLLCSSSSSPPTTPPPQPESASVSDPAPPPEPPVSNVTNAEFKTQIEKYLLDHDEQALPKIFQSILARKIAGNHSETDEELVDELRFKPRDDIKDREFESDFEEMHETDEELPDLYNAREYVQNKMAKDEFFNMDDKKWDEMIREATEKGFLKDTKECEDILEDMLNWDKLLPGQIS